MLEPDPNINCPIDLFPKQESKIQELTQRINEAKRIQQKAELAQALLAEVEVLLQCSAFDKGNIHCLSCQTISGARSNAATLLLNTEKALNQDKNWSSPGMVAGPMVRRAGEARRTIVTSLREAALAKLAQARTVLEDLGRQREIIASEWQKGYVKALEETLDLEGLSLRRYPRRPTAIPTEIARMFPEQRALGQRGKGTIVDLSVGSCGLATAMALSAGEIIELSFPLPESSTPVTLEGWVRRAQRTDGEFRAGVEFKLGGLLGYDRAVSGSHESAVNRTPQA